MGGNVAMRLSAVMILLTLPNLVVLQKYESLPPSFHPHPALLSPHLLSPSPSSLSPSDFRLPRLWSPRRAEAFRIAKCIGACALDCLKLHGKDDPKIFADCFGESVRFQCSFQLWDSVYDCAHGCSVSAITHFDLGSDEANGYMQTCSRGCIDTP